MDQKTYTNFSWITLIAVMTVGITAWSQTISWDFGSLTAYQWFPLLGILAWMIMWTHYITAVPRVMNPELKKSRSYYKVSSYIVLACLLLHPGILALVQFQNDQGVPPNSFVEYVGESMRLAVFLDTIGLTIFLSYEYFERVQSKAWAKRWWWLVSISQSLAMTVIFVHGLRLGTTLGDGWFRLVWFIMGAALIPCFYLFHKADFTRQ